MQDGNYWHGKRVALLGGASLIGTHLAEALVNKGVSYLVVADDLSAGEQNLPLLTKLGLHFIRCDLREYSSALRAIDHADIVFHLAAQHGGRGYVASHKTNLYDNLDLDATIFRACAHRTVEKVIFSSSACAYPIDLQDDPDVEFYLSEGMIDYNNIRQPDGPYGLEKLTGELMLDAYIEAGAFGGCSTRSFTVFGPRMTETHAIAAMIARTMIRQDPFEIWGDRNNPARRNWTYVEDNVAGALLAAEHLDRGAINIGVEEYYSPFRAARTIWEIMEEATGWYPEEAKFLPDKPVGPLNRVASASKLMSLGWQPKFTFEEGLRRTIDWYLSTHTAEEVALNFERKLTER